MKKTNRHCSRRDFLRLAAAGTIASMVPSCVTGVKEKNRPNILFVIFDDLRPTLGCYGNNEIRTPYLDEYSRQSMVFRQSYCQAAVCAPSRASVMTGLRPDTSHVWHLKDKFRVNMPDVVTIPQHFHAYGYYTVSMGKIFHNYMPDPVSFDEADLRPEAFNTPDMIDRDAETFYYDEEIKKEHALVRAERIRENPDRYGGGWAYGRSTECADAPDEALYDGAQTELAIETLKRLKNKDQPFFLAVGYYRPHLPFVAPKKYWDLYDQDSISPAANPFLPKDSPIMAMNSAYELNSCYDLEHVKHPAIGSLPEKTARLLKHGYYASVSYVDACFGKLIASLKEQGLSKNTIVVVWGDHGWKLGEHGSWCKQTNYNIDTRVPLIIHAPAMQAKGQSCDKLTELVDIYPTLCDLAGLEIPENLEGTSLKPLLNNPDLSWKSAVFSQYHRRPKVSLDKKRYMGYSMVTTKYHYVEWYYWDEVKQVAGDHVGTELYDLTLDPQENVNIANLPENIPKVIKLAKQLKAGWRAALPK
ncbi:MAG: sulfatase-like hydrolase/transferase [Sedimentisphaerales bacterium]|nr:sulfatase-like hydrolase/transferase [Sedimentisphaerales bacterium]